MKILSSILIVISIVVCVLLCYSCGYFYGLRDGLVKKSNEQEHRIMYLEGLLQSYSDVGFGSDL